MADGTSNYKIGINLDPQSTDPTNPAEGDIFRSDGTVRAVGVWEYKNGAWVQLGSGGQGGINYLSPDSNDAESDVGDWTIYVDAAGENPVDGTGGTLADVSLTQNSTTPLRGDGDFKFTKTATDAQGQGASVDFTIDNADKAKKLTISFDYDASNANYADDDMRVAIYDVTNATLIRVNGEDLKGGKGTHYAQFQTASNSTSYRLILHVSSTNATAYDVYFDNVKVGPSDVGIGTNGEVVVRGAGNAGAAITASTEAIDFTLVEDTTASWSQVGVHGTDSFTAPETGYYTIHGSVLITGTGNRAILSYVDGTYSKVLGNGSDGASSNLFPFSGIEYLEKGQVFTARIDGTVTLSNNVNGHWIHIQKIGTSSEARATVGGGRDVAVLAYKTTGQAIPATTITKINLDTTTHDTASSFNLASNRIDIQETGFYDIEAAVGYSTGSTALAMVCYVYKNGTELCKGISHKNTINVDLSAEISQSVELVKGDYLELYTFITSAKTTNTGSGDTFLSVIKNNSGKTALETETVAARYTSDNGQAFSNATVIKYEDIDYDTHNAYDITTGIYTVPISGYYQVNACYRVNSSAATIGNVIGIAIDVDGTLAGEVQTVVETTSSTTRSGNISETLYLNKGQQVSIEGSENITAGQTLITTSRFNTFSIARIK